MKNSEKDVIPVWNRNPFEKILKRDECNDINPIKKTKVSFKTESKAI